MVAPLVCVSVVDWESNHYCFPFPAALTFHFYCSHIRLSLNCTLLETIEAALVYLFISFAFTIAYLSCARLYKIYRSRDQKIPKKCTISKEMSIINYSLQSVCRKICFVFSDCSKLLFDSIIQSHILLIYENVQNCIFTQSQNNHTN